MGLFTDMYGRDQNLKLVMMEAILAGKGGFFFKDDNLEADVATHSDIIFDIV